MTRIRVSRLFASRTWMIQHTRRYRQVNEALYNWFMSHEMIASYQRGENLPNGRYAHRSWWNQRPNLIYRPGQGIFNRSYLPCLSSQSSQVGFSRTEMLKLDWKNRSNNPPPPLKKRRLPLHDALKHMYRAFSSNGQRLHDARINELHHLTDFIFNQSAPLPLVEKL